MALSMNSLARSLYRIICVHEVGTYYIACHGAYQPFPWPDQAEPAIAAEQELTPLLLPTPIFKHCYLLPV